ncbi:MAG: hypothetical protein QNJ72_16380 [Pleurocapsa sp. MO_226.B13]|nr:hypothetical protein [Pleurocapsa sp. MO_226.B13]
MICLLDRYSWFFEMQQIVLVFALQRGFVSQSASPQGAINQRIMLKCDRPLKACYSNCYSKSEINSS